MSAASSKRMTRYRLRAVLLLFGVLHLTALSDLAVRLVRCHKPGPVD